MARLTNKQLKIVVDEVFNKISLPIINSNKKLIEKVKLPKFQYFKDKKEYDELSDKIKKLEEAKQLLVDKYYRSEYEGFNFNYSPFFSSDDFKMFKKKELVTLIDYPSKQEIEKQVILTGNSDIPRLIEELINKLK